MADIKVTVGGELPDWTFAWMDDAGDLIDFSANYTFTLRIGDSSTGILEQTTGITGAATDPNVTIAFAVGTFDSITPGVYAAELWARRTSDSKDRDPLRFTVQVLAAIPSPA